MDLYSILREFADSWALLALFTFFIGMALFVFRPGSKALHADAAQVPLRERDTPMTCAGACPACTCATIPEGGAK
ncbi:cbb3-type cytochrome c oxidase subunit 3 [Jannaschia sp. M317]|uniref:cbb3-type cytochrome c oxidase subunit 3 n=1 Tax=Jannaschia sp. M317 TaxID=2867011 RepID=UPI0021A377CC|nr:cbb3-type cytochrome c oxidase subunit 3 [Jannaschia sp. M317]UWQ16848.1 cbb3-type cytochrome c oxidase subunit 3 [Jannaschia sp. M317]